MSPISQILDHFRTISRTERELGTRFENLTACYLRYEPSYHDLYDEVLTFAEWARTQHLDARDTGIDLVAKTRHSGEYHAIQCKCYASAHQINKHDIDSFFTASGKQPFTHRLIICSTNKWSAHAEDALREQQIPVTKIDLHDLETSQIDWTRYQELQAPPLKPQKTLRKHQISAVENVLLGLNTAARGKLIMACGTGKTFTSLKIAEQFAGRGGRVLFLVPSLALLSQVLTEWTQESALPLHSFAVCSDSEVGKKRNDQEADPFQSFAYELRYPATTNAAALAREMQQRHDAQHLSVVFSTYHSLAVLNQAQQEYALPAFDLIICDEAHRTTGAVFADAAESIFTKVHNNEFISANKRLYMTATPRIYGDNAKAKATQNQILLCSMDDETLYGKEWYVINFSAAVKRDLLVDYKVIVLAVAESHISSRLQNLLKDDNNTLKVADAARIVGCWKALAKQGLTLTANEDADYMRRAVAFCQVIEQRANAKSHKVSSKEIARLFQTVVAEYQKAEDPLSTNALQLRCEVDHVDGTMNASTKETKLAWLKAATVTNTCRILSNVRCLSEGVDVPALDAVLFLSPRNSQVDVVQSVGRVMRKAPNSNKQRGYVILPVVIPAGVAPHEALNDNQTYAVVWQVLQALRAHDDSFDAMINKLELIGKHTSKIEVIAVIDQVPTSKPSAAKKFDRLARGTNLATAAANDSSGDLPFAIGEIERAIYAKLVEKVGNRHHWEDWANDIAKIAQTHINRLQGILNHPFNLNERAVFAQFANALRSNLNDRISNDAIIEMLAQHLITQPVFDALFANYNFAAQNPMSQALQRMLNLLQEHHLNKETETLHAFYDSVKLRAAGIENAAGKQKIILELYDKFFRNAFPKLTERLGIVYTPVEIVDFIIHSVNHLLEKEFNQNLGSEHIQILDPFTGTGTFITRLLQSGLISKTQLPIKYSEIHANEIVLLAYYIAAINIEATYHELSGGDYQPFPGICFTDTFQQHEKPDLVETLLIANSTRQQQQTALNICVIIGNPPYSAGQNSANDNNQNLAYPDLDKRIENTYAARSKAVLSKGLYDSYIRAIRWASDRIKDCGVIGFVTNAGFIDSNSADGLRKCLAEEFSSIYILHLRGNARTSGELRRKEKDNIFGIGSRAPIAISILVKNPTAKLTGQIYFYDIGDYLSREEKLDKISNYVSIAGIDNWQLITPDQHGDWLKQRDNHFNKFIALGDKKGDTLKLFDNYSLGVATNRDAWCYNFSHAKVAANMQRMIGFYNSEVNRFAQAFNDADKKIKKEQVNDFVNNDPTQISWTRALKQELVKNRPATFLDSALIQSLYRPFTKQWLYFDRKFNEMVLQMPRIFPNPTAENLVICVSGIGSKDFSALIANKLPDIQLMFNGQCFPLYLYEESLTEGADLFAAEKPKLIRKDGITNQGLAHVQNAYPAETISKEALFYYIYGLLHSPEYRELYANNLGKELPRIPCVNDFGGFERAGRKLAELHLNYETVPMYAANLIGDDGKHYHVEKMRFGANKDKSMIIYNDWITVSDIPLQAYEYVVNGKAAIEWVMERQGVKIDPDSKIVNDANQWAVATMNNARYPLELLLRIITVSLETIKIIKELPGLDGLE